MSKQLKYQTVQEIKLKHVKKFRIQILQEPDNVFDSFHVLFVAAFWTWVLLYSHNNIGLAVKDGP